jgi:hypothetical protein
MRRGQNGSQNPTMAMLSSSEDKERACHATQPLTGFCVELRELGDLLVLGVQKHVLPRPRHDLGVQLLLNLTPVQTTRVVSVNA